MKRSEFLHTAILAAITVPLAPKLLTEEPKMVWRELVPARTFGGNSLYTKDRIVFKVSGEMLKDEQAFEYITKDIELTRKIKSLEVGHMDDDFCKNLYTVKILFV
jgi:hypothetical protein